MKRVLFGLFVLVGTVCAQPADLRLRLVDPHAFRERELVRLEMSEPGRGWWFLGFVIEPARDCGTMAKPCSPWAMKAVNGPGQASPVIVLNRFVQDLSPGTYRIKALARRLMADGRPIEPPQYAMSDALEFQVIASSAAWVQETIAKSVAALKSTASNVQEQEAQERAAEQLSWLDTPAARDAALDLLPGGEQAILGGLHASREPARVCDQMRARIGYPAQSVSSYYISTLVDLCAKAHLPPAPPMQGGPWFARAVLSAVPPKALPVAPVDPARQAWFDKDRAYREDLWSQTTAALAASLSSKQAEPKWTAFATSLDRVTQVRLNQSPQPDPAWIPTLTAEFVGAYVEKEMARRQTLFRIFTSTIKTPESAVLLERVLDAWKPGEYYEAHTAVRALNAIDPARAQARIRAELTNSHTWLDVPLLSLLPPGALPAMDDALIDALATAQRPQGWNPNLRMAALARYGTKAALARMKAIYESQQQPCQPELLAYFVRVDPAYADGVLRAKPWDMHAPAPMCTVQYFNRTAPLAMSPGLEQYIAAYLMHSDVHVKTTAAHALARYGSPAALPKLWETLRYFHEWWQGKDAELEKNGEAAMLEVELANAIGRGLGWLATAAELRQVESLCIGQRCRVEMQSGLSVWEAPLRIDLIEGQYRVAQYYGMQTLAELEAKLAQFPRGTKFLLSGGGSEAEEVRRFAADHGLDAR
jgi:hypothetical protein